MDYIIFGIGSSATLVLAGWLLRDWGPRLRDRTPPDDEILSASNLVSRMAWARFCATCGMAILICGVLVMLVTLGAAFLAPSDRFASIAVVVAFGASAVLMLLWTGLYLRQFGAMGVLRPREKKAPEVPAEPAPTEVASQRATDGASEAPARSFAETTASRGGLGRFAAFFRKDTDTGVPSDQTAIETPSAADDTATAAAGDADHSPTDAVIAELAGAPGEGDDKRLKPDDPLVTAVRSSAPDPSMQSDVTPGVIGPVLDEIPADRPATPEVSGIQDSQPEGDASVAGASDQEQALSQLRRRRLSRLANPSDRD